MLVVTEDEATSFVCRLNRVGKPTGGLPHTTVVLTPGDPTGVGEFLTCNATMAGVLDKSSFAYGLDLAGLLNLVSDAVATLWTLESSRSAVSSVNKLLGVTNKRKWTTRFEAAIRAVAATLAERLESECAKRRIGIRGPREFRWDPASGMMAGRGEMTNRPERVWLSPFCEWTACRQFGEASLVLAHAGSDGECDKLWHFREGGFEVFDEPNRVCAVRVPEAVAARHALADLLMYEVVEMAGGSCEIRDGKGGTVRLDASEVIPVAWE